MKKKSFLIIMCLYITACNLYCIDYVSKPQPSDVEKLWKKTFGGIGDDVANSIQQTKDGGYIVAGFTNSFGKGESDMYILKLDADGTCKWEKTFGGIEGDVANSIQQTKDGGYIIAGFTNSFGKGGSDMYILKLDADGTCKWEKTFGGIEGDVAFSIQQTRDNGYIVAGFTYSNKQTRDVMYILKLDADGTREWEKEIVRGTWGEDVAVSIQQTTDHGYIIAGYTFANTEGSADMYILKLDADGTCKWEKTFGGINEDRAFSIQQTRDNGYIVAGYSYSFGKGGSDMYILKLDADGTCKWEKTFGGIEGDIAESIQQTTDNGYIVAGYTDSNTEKRIVMYILKLDADGTCEWEKEIGVTTGNQYADQYSDAFANSIRQTSDGSYIVAGYIRLYGTKRYDMCILLLNADGSINKL